MQLWTKITPVYWIGHCVGNRATGRISKRVLQEMFVFQKIWYTLFSCNTRFEIRPFALLPKTFGIVLKRADFSLVGKF